MTFALAVLGVPVDAAVLYSIFALLMSQIHQTTDPTARQKLMDQQYELMRNQMKDMGTMHDCMIGHGMSEHGMTGQQMMGHGMKQPGSQSQAD